MKDKKIESGVYLVVDPSYGEDKVIKVAEESMRAGLDVLQLWASWSDDKKAAEIGRRLTIIAMDYSVPFGSRDRGGWCTYRRC